MFGREDDRLGQIRERETLVKHGRVRTFTDKAGLDHLGGGRVNEATSQAEIVLLGHGAPPNTPPNPPV